MFTFLTLTPQAAVNSEKLSVPRSHTGVGGVTATLSGAPPKATRSVYAFGSHGPSVCSLPPGTSGENRASAEADAPGCRTIRAEVAVPGCAGWTFVGRSRPPWSRSWTFGRPDTKHATGAAFVTC